MYIKTLNISHFGKFHHKTVHLEDGINIIEGHNESGKSTIHAFIKGMLFGIDKTRGRESKDDLYGKYQPWDNPTSFSGGIDVELNGSFYRINRNFYKETKESTMYQLDSGRETILGAGERLPILEGVNRTTFQNTISIEQLKPETDNSFVVEVQNYYTNLTTAKHGNVSISAAIENLKKEKKAVDLDNLRGQISEVDQTLAEIEGLKQEKKELEEKLVEVESLDISEEKKAEINEFMVTKQEIGDKAYAYQILCDQITEYDETVTRSQYEKKKESARGKNYEMLFAGCILALIGCVVGVALQKMAFLVASLVVLVLVLAAIYIYPMIVAKRKPAEKTAQEEEYLQLLISKQKKLEEELTAYQKQFQMEQMPVDEFARQIKNRLELQFKNLSLEVKEESTVRERRILELKVRLQQLEEKISMEKMLEQKREELISLYQQKTREVKMIDLAMEQIKALSITIHDSFGKELNRELSEVVSQLTNGNYSKVFVDEKMNIFVEYDRKRVPIHKLSTGTIHQIYFALRIIFARQLFPNSKLPLILDETFVYYDNTRLEEVLKILPKDQQIILFTCQNRERKLCDKLGISYHHVNL